MIPYLRLVRAGAAFSPAADVIAGMCLVGLPWSMDAGRACIASALVYLAGMALNDHADRHEDARNRPERPIPAGQISPTSALLFGFALLIGGVACSPIPIWHGALALLVLAYDYVLKRWTLAGALCMGSLRGLNLAAGAMLLPELSGEQVHVVFYAGGAYGLAILAITLLGALEDHKNVRPKAVHSLLSVPPLAWFLAILTTAQGMLAPGLGIVAICAFAARNRRVTEWNPGAIRGAMLWLLLGTSLYDALLCVGQERYWEALGIALTIPIARFVARWIAPT